MKTAAADDRLEAVQRSLTRYELQSQESRLSFVAAALMGADQIARTLQTNEAEGLPRGITAAMHEALRLRRAVREQIRKLEAERELKTHGDGRECRRQPSERGGIVR